MSEGSNPSPSALCDNELRLEVKNLEKRPSANNVCVIGSAQAAFWIRRGETQTFSSITSARCNSTTRPLKRTPRPFCSASRDRFVGGNWQ